MRKSFIISSLTAMAAFCLCVNAQAQGPVVVSDKDDYSPGETALFQAAGFQPGELLDFSIAVGGDNGTWVPDIAWADISADGAGGAEVDYIVPETWWGKTLQLTVMGLGSGLTASTTFTDGASNVQFATTGLPAGTSVSVSYNGTNPGGGTQIGTSTFNSPGPGATIGFKGGTAVSFTFPASITVGANSYDFVSASPASGFIAPDTGPPTPTTTVTGTYQLHVITPTNNPPQITCLSNDADLGQVVGCLGTGSGFGQTFPVSYSNDGPGTTVTVTATFTLPDSSTVDVDVATVTDPDGDSVTVTTSNGTSPVMISGPGSASAPFSVDIHADDGQTANNTADQTCGGNANATVTYGFNGLFSPLSNVASTKVKQGASVPVKFQLTDCSGTLITPTNMPGDGSAPMVDVIYISGAAPNGEPTVTDAGNSNGDTVFARWDPTGMQWIFNLKTNNTYNVGNTYGIQVLPNDGSTHQANISIK
jgi:hypothetical protein